MSRTQNGFFRKARHSRPLKLPSCFPPVCTAVWVLRLSMCAEWKQELSSGKSQENSPFTYCQTLLQLPSGLVWGWKCVQSLINSPSKHHIQQTMFVLALDELLLCRFSCVRLCATPQAAAHQAPPSLEFSRQEYWSGLPFPSPMHACILSRFSRVRLCVTPNGQQPTRLLCPWDSLGKSTGVGWHILLPLDELTRHISPRRGGRVTLYFCNGDCNQWKLPMMKTSLSSSCLVSSSHRSLGQWWGNLTLRFLSLKNGTHNLNSAGFCVITEIFFKSQFPHMQKGTFQVRMEPGGCLVKCSNTMVISTMAKKNLTEDQWPSVETTLYWLDDLEQITRTRCTSSFLFCK